MMPWLLIGLTSQVAKATAPIAVIVAADDRVIAVGADDRGTVVGTTDRVIVVPQFE